MAIEHLNLIEKLLSEDPKKSFARTAIRDELNINFNTMMEALNYLKKEGKITTTMDKNILRYRWSGNE